jgi:hypothetical protein
MKKESGTEVTNSPSHLGRKTNRHLDVIQPFPFCFGKERRSPSEPSNEEIRGEQSANGARSAHAERARRKIKCGGEAAELIPFASWAQSRAVFPGQIKDLGLRQLDLYMNRRYGYLNLKKKRFHSTPSKDCA